MSQKKYWVGDPGSCCQVTDAPFNGVMYAVRIPGLGLWGNVCYDAFVALGCQLGVGHGQKYRQQDDGRWLLVEGGAS